MQIISKVIAYKIQTEIEHANIKKPASVFFYKNNELLIGGDGICAYSMDEVASILPNEIIKNGHRYHFSIGKAINPYKEMPEMGYVAGYINRSGSNFIIKFHNINPAEAVGELLLWWLKEQKNV